MVVVLFLYSSFALGKNDVSLPVQVSVNYLGRFGTWLAGGRDDYIAGKQILVPGSLLFRSDQAFLVFKPPGIFRRIPIQLLLPPDVEKRLRIHVLGKEPWVEEGSFIQADGLPMFYVRSPQALTRTFKLSDEHRVTVGTRQLKIQRDDTRARVQEEKGQAREIGMVSLSRYLADLPLKDMVTFGGTSFRIVAYDRNRNLVRIVEEAGLMRTLSGKSSQVELFEVDPTLLNIHGTDYAFEYLKRERDPKARMTMADVYLDNKPKKVVTKKKPPLPTSNEKTLRMLRGLFPNVIAEIPPQWVNDDIAALNRYLTRPTLVPPPERPAEVSGPSIEVERVKARYSIWQASIRRLAELEDSFGKLLREVEEMSASPVRDQRELTDFFVQMHIDLQIDMQLLKSFETRYSELLEQAHRASQLLANDSWDLLKAMGQRAAMVPKPAEFGKPPRGLVPGQVVYMDIEGNPVSLQRDELIRQIESRLNKCPFDRILPYR